MSLGDVVQTVAAELIERFPGPDAPSRRDLKGLALLAVVVEAEGQAIRARGCGADKANNFAQMHARLRDDLRDLGSATAGTMAAGALTNADALSAATLALMEVQGNA